MRSNSARISCDDTALQCTGRNQPICKSRAMSSYEADGMSTVAGLSFTTKTPLRMAEIGRIFVTTRTITAFAIAFSLLFLAASVASLAADQTIDGKIVRHGEWRSMKPKEAVIDIADLKDFSHSTFFLRTQQRTRDNAVVEQRLRFNEAAGYIGIQRARIFNYAATRYFDDQKAAKKKIDRFYGKQIRTVDYEEARRIYRYGTRGGWLHVVRDKPRRNAPDRTLHLCLSRLSGRASEYTITMA